MKMKSGFRNTQWDPLLLIAQIIAVQSVLYVSLGFLMAFMDVLVGANHTLDHLFQYHVRPLKTNKHSQQPLIIDNISNIYRKYMSPMQVVGPLSYRLW